MPTTSITEERNLLREFLVAQRRLHPRKGEDHNCELCVRDDKNKIIDGPWKYGFWAKRWEIRNEATLRRWARGDRRIGPSNRHIFEDPLVAEFRFEDDPDLRLNMDSYYRFMPPSDQGQTRSDPKRSGSGHRSRRRRANARRVRGKTKAVRAGA